MRNILKEITSVIIRSDKDSLLEDFILRSIAHVAQLGLEHFSSKEKVAGSSPAAGSDFHNIICYGNPYKMIKIMFSNSIVMSSKILIN